MVVTDSLKNSETFQKCFFKQTENGDSGEKLAEKTSFDVCCVENLLIGIT